MLLSLLLRPLFLSIHPLFWSTWSPKHSHSSEIADRDCAVGAVIIRFLRLHRTPQEVHGPYVRCSRLVPRRPKYRLCAAGKLRIHCVCMLGSMRTSMMRCSRQQAGRTWPPSRHRPCLRCPRSSHSGTSLAYRCVMRRLLTALMSLNATVMARQ